MNNAEVLKTLRGTTDFSALKDAVLRMCGPRGPAISYEFIFHSEKRSVSCLLEMKYSLPDAEMRELGAFGFANVVCLEFEIASAQLLSAFPLDCRNHDTMDPAETHSSPWPPA